MTDLKNKMLTQVNKSYFIIIAVAILFILPQLITQNMVIGSDAIFHFNRFYETSQQLRENNFDYFISLYGFQQSGRIVNAFYGPFLAYIQGFFVLISKNWFVYQIISNFILFIVSGFSMYVFLKAGRLSNYKSCIGAILYMASFSILYWVTRQGFSSWGAAILPLCLTIVFDVLETKEVPEYKLGFFTALLFQIHLLSTFVLILIYTPLFFYAFIKSNDKLFFLWSMLKEISLFVFLTLNIWIVYFTIVRENNLVAPFVNYDMASNTINQNSFYWLYNPVCLIFIIVIVFWKSLFDWKINEMKVKILFTIMAFFFILSTSIIPWNALVEKKIKVVELIQFPFRFFVPVTILGIYLFLYFLDLRKRYLILATMSILQVLLLLTVSLYSWNTEDNFINAGSKAVIANENSDVIKKSFFMKDKQLALNMVEKSTPDYLPVYGDFKGNYYEAYDKKIIQKNKYLTKSLNDSTILIEFTDWHKKEIELPIIVYKDTILMTGEKQLTRGEYRLSQIGTPIIPTELIENNQIKVKFDAKRKMVFVSLTIVIWLFALIRITANKIMRNTQSKNDLDSSLYRREDKVW